MLMWSENLAVKRYKSICNLQVALPFSYKYVKNEGGLILFWSCFAASCTGNLESAGHSEVWRLQRHPGAKHSALKKTLDYC